MSRIGFLVEVKVRKSDEVIGDEVTRYFVNKKNYSYAQYIATHLLSHFVTRIIKVS